MDKASDASYRDLEQVAALLANAFESLLSQVDHLAQREEYLTSRLFFAYEEYRLLALHRKTGLTDSTYQRDVLHQIKLDVESPLRPTASSVPLDQIAARYGLEAAFEACRTLRANSRPQKNGEPHAMVEKHTMAVEDLEHDFTTRNGTPSKLECPFARLKTGDSQRETDDPIAAEFHGDGSVGLGTAYAHQNPNQCPIRYLDRHSPEEVTKYFENHKHEIPRSHALCISIYKQNDAKIRQLDAKYGNLQNMIQSLGVKHQQYLPVKNRQKDFQRDASQPAAEMIEKWAANVSRASADTTPPPVEARGDVIEDGEQQERMHHFERSLREIRLGESPSRPWGISVPLTQEATASAILSENGMEQQLLDKPKEDSTLEGQKEGKGAVRCPIDYAAHNKEPPNGATQVQITAAAETGDKEPPLHPQMIFNGPVFFGYSPEQVTTLRQSDMFDYRNR